MTRRFRKRVYGVVALAALLDACVHTHVADAPVAGAPTEGSATLVIGDQRYRLGECHSGDHEYFLGVDLRDRAASAWVRLVIDPLDGPMLRIVEDEGRAEYRLSRAQCAELRADLRETGWRVNHVRDYSGSLVAECTARAGEQISVHARFEHCH